MKTVKWLFFANQDLQRRLDYAKWPPKRRAGQRPRDVSLIVNVLCLDGCIPAGKYIIDTRPEPATIDQYRVLLRQTGTPESKECSAFRRAHEGDKTLTRLAAEIDTAVLNALREHPS